MFDMEVSQSLIEGANNNFNDLKRLKCWKIFLEIYSYNPHDEDILMEAIKNRWGICLHQVHQLSFSLSLRDKKPWSQECGARCRRCVLLYFIWIWFIFLKQEEETLVPLRNVVADGSRTISSPSLLTKEIPTNTHCQMWTKKMKI